jgi:hypothetical protein
MCTICYCVSRTYQSQNKGFKNTAFVTLPYHSMMVSHELIQIRVISFVATKS